MLPFWPIGSGTKRTNLIWSRNCLRRSGTFLCNRKTYGLKQNILIWSGKCLMQSGTFLVNIKTHRSKQNVLNWYKLFFCQSRSFSFWPKRSGTEAKQFDAYSAEFKLFLPFSIKRAGATMEWSYAPLAFR